MLRLLLVSITTLTLALVSLSFDLDSFGLRGTMSVAVDVAVMVLLGALAFYSMWLVGSLLEKTECD